jgi:hypothetical protein
MSTAAVRAEARRKAILAKRGDRLAKLTNSARGDEGTFLSDGMSIDKFSVLSPFMCADVSSVSSLSRSFLGEEPNADMPAPSRLSVGPSPGPTQDKPSVASPEAPTPVFSPSTQPETLFSDVDEIVWSPEQQAQFRAALLSANPMHSSPGSRVPSGAAVSNRGTSPGLQTSSNTEEIDPFAEIMASLGGSIPSQSPGLDMFQVLQKMRQGAQPTNPESEVPRYSKAIWRFVQLISTWGLLA